MHPEKEYQMAPQQIAEGLREAFERIWDATVALPRQNRGPVQGLEIIEPWDGAVAWIGGSWTGNVRIFSSPGLAAVIANAILPEGADTVSDVVQQDVMRELSNMVAGNLKSLLGGECALATPGNFSVRMLSDLADEFTPIATLTYKVGPFTIQISANELSRDSE
ncbi:MAG: chemotaxis protein CheX [Proteobacteria bacterium]|nr:chemotaxis protein CheX [Pseudomonadota bacterium]